MTAQQETVGNDRHEKPEQQVSTQSLQLPVVSIVTPSFNMAPFLEETILSVLNQDYPHIEYVVMDAGSTDNTLQILKKYEQRLRWISQPDNGAADAINRGLKLCTGSICGWLSADDVYHPGAVAAAVKHLQSNADALAVYGEGVWVDAKGCQIGAYPTHPDATSLLWRECLICQPACFFLRKPAELIGFLDDSLHCAFDYDFWIRLSRHGRFLWTDQILANSRIHPQVKTVRERTLVLLEAMRVQQTHFGYVPFQSIYDWCCHRLAPRDPFETPVHRSVTGYLLSLPAGLWYNRNYLRRYAREWFDKLSWKGLHRLVRDTRQRRTGRTQSNASG